MLTHLSGEETFHVTPGYFSSSLVLHHQRLYSKFCVLKCNALDSFSPFNAYVAFQMSKASSEAPHFFAIGRAHSSFSSSCFAAHKQCFVLVGESLTIFANTHTSYACSWAERWMGNFF